MNRPSKYLAILASASFFILSSPSIVQADTDGTVRVVTPDTLHLDGQSWYFYDDVADTPSTVESPGNYEFVLGPAPTPAGIGSVRFDTEGSERWNMATVMFGATPLSSFTELKFDTYQPSSNPAATGSNAAVYLNFDVDFGTGLPGYQRRLVFVPSVNGTVQQDVWQEWDAIQGGDALWTWSGWGNAGQWPDGEVNQYRTWSDILAAFPDIEVLDGGQLLFRAGEPYPAGFTGYLDKATFGIDGETVVFDFEVDSLRAEKQDVLAHIDATANGANERDARRLNEAARKLDESLATALWVDGLHLVAKKGSKVFDREMETVQKLVELRNDRKTETSSALVQGWIDHLVAIDRRLAEIAIDEATDASAIARAEKELAKGDQDAAAGKPASAIDHYGKAWSQATR